jgi:hypothetical protein
VIIADRGDHLDSLSVEFDRRLFPKILALNCDRTVRIIGFRPVNYGLILIFGHQRTGERNQTRKRQQPEK